MPVEPADARAQQLLAEGKALRLLARSLLSAHDADDAVQQTWLTALREPAAGRGYLRPWLRLTLRRVAAGWRRGERRRAGREREVAPSEAQRDADPALIAQEAELIAAVGAAVQALHEPLRTAVVLRFWHGLPPDAIAQRLGVERNTVRSRLRRGVELLRVRLDARYGTQAGWAAPMSAFAAVRTTTAPVVALGGGGLLLAGMLMKTKLSLGVAAVLLAAVAIPWSFAGERPAQIPVEAGPTPTTDVAEALAPPEPRRQQVTVPPAAAPAAFDSSPVRVESWLARMRVIDEAGAPVDDATITVRAARKVQGDGSDRQDPPAGAYTYRGATDQVCGTARTDLHGRASIDLGLEACIALASKPGFAPAGETWLMHDRASKEETRITLQAPLRIRGIVQRADGAPAAGARVIANATGFLTGQRGTSAAPEPVLADAAGRFELIAGEGTYTLRAELDDVRSFAERLAVRRGGDAQVVLEFPGARSIAGEVVDAEGSVVAGAEVRAWREAPASSLARAIAYERGFGRTDAQGRFSIDVRSLARYQLIAAAPTHANSELLWTDATAAQPHAFVRLQLRTFVSLRGTVRRQSGPPLAGLTVYGVPDTDLCEDLQTPGRADAFAPCQAAITDPDGSFELRVQPGVAWNVTTVSTRGALRLRLGSASSVAAGANPIEIVVPDALLTSCTVRGSVVHAADHGPVTGFRVLLAQQDGTRRVSPGVAKAEITGNAFVLTDLPVGYRYVLQIEPTVREGGTWSPVRVSFSTTVDGAEVQVRVPEWGTLPVRLVAPEGKNLEAVTWSLSRDFLNTRAFMPGSVDATGRGSREHIVPGDYQLSVLRSFASIHQQDVTVLPGLNAEVEVRLPPTPERQ